MHQTATDKWRKIIARVVEFNEICFSYEINPKQVEPPLVMVPYEQEREFVEDLVELPIEERPTMMMMIRNRSKPGRSFRNLNNSSPKSKRCWGAANDSASFPVSS